MKKPLTLILFFLSLLFSPVLADQIIPPQYPVSQSVRHVLEIAANEVGYREGEHGRSKYGEWAGDPYAQWCAEFLCWCVDQADQKHGTKLLRNQYPMYSGQNVGLRWFLREGRFVARNGHVDNWGYQWLRDQNEFLTTGDYIPQPGDWVFFTWTSDSNTDHVAMVEYCSIDEDGNVTIHVIEGNAPVAVARNEYALTNKRILGYGTVHDVAEITMRSGCQGRKVSTLQKKLQYLHFLEDSAADGHFGSKTQDAIRWFQESAGLKITGIANIETQKVLDYYYFDALQHDSSAWIVTDDTE